VNKFFITLVSLISISISQFSSAQDMSFFVTSVGSGNGGNLGGLKGADAHCQKLAMAAGAGKKTWQAYLSTVEAKGQAQVNARDRIGTGPWYNAKGILIAKNIADLHSTNNINKQNSLSEKGTVIKGRGDKPNQHDILTGSLENGMPTTNKGNSTCSNWTSNSKGSAIVGHHDKKGPPGRTSWNSAHDSFGCSPRNLKTTGGNGYFYCFATD